MDDVKGTVSVDIYYGSTLSTGSLNYTKTGYKHVGWSTAPPTLTGSVYVTGSGEDFYPLDIVYDKTDDMTLYPVYALVHDLGPGVVTINDNGYHYVSKTSGGVSTSNNLRITGGSPTVILDNVTMTSSSSSISPIDIYAGAELHLTPWGSSSLEGYSGSSLFGSATSTAAVRVRDNATLVITEYSTGSLNAKGGNASSLISGGVYGASGIGSNGGNPAPACGTITIRGGHIVATGGSSTYGFNAGGSGSVDPGAGIGGAGADLNLEGGVVEVVSGSYSGNESGLRDPATSLEGDSINYGDDVVVVQHNGQSQSDGMAIVEFTGLSSAVAMQSISLKGVSFPLSGQSFGPQASGGVSSMTVPLEAVEENSLVVLVATNGTIYTGTAVLDANYLDGVKYTVVLSVSTQSMNYVTIMASKDSDGTAPGGSVNPYGSQTFPISDTSFMISAYPSLGYRISGVTVSSNGSTWSELTEETDYDILGSQILIKTITNGMRYSVEFAPLEYTAVVDTVMPNNPSWTGASDPLGITVSSGTNSWSGNVATISGVAYNSSLKVTVDTKTAGNPHILKHVTVNGAVHTPVDMGNGVYEISVNSVTSDLDIKITLAATVKLTFDYSDPLFGDEDADNHFNLYDKNGANPQVVPASNGFYVEKGTSRKFSVSIDEAMADVCIFELRIGSSLMPVQPLYDTGQMSADTTVTIELREWTHQVTINYWNGSYSIGFVNQSQTVLPAQAGLETMGYMRPGYNLSGWTDVSGGTVPVYAPGTQITVTGDTTFWPVWALAQYTITYNMNGGDLPAPAGNPDGFNINDAAFGLVLPTRTGYAPGHWEMSDGTPISAVDPQTYPRDMVLYAVWGDPNTYTVTFVDEPPTGVTSSVTYGSKYGALPVLPSNADRSFSGWSLDIGGSERVVSTTIMSKGENHNLYAVWVPKDQWVIELTGPGAKAGSLSVPASVPDGQTALLVMTPNTGYKIDSVILSGSGSYSLDGTTWITFSGMNITISMGGSESQTSFWMIPSENVIVIVVMSPVEYTVTVECGLCDTDPLGHTHTYTYTVESGSWIIPVPTTVHTNFVFTGWSGPGITDVSLDPLVINTGSTGNRTYTMNWQSNVWAIQYFLSEGHLSGQAYEYVSGGAVVTFPAPVRTGYVFMGWYTDPDFTLGNEITSTAGRTGVLNLYAKFVIGQYTITFDSAGGSAVSAITQDYGTAVTPPAAPTRDGYTFTGWSPIVPATMPGANVTLTAQWTINQYTITFNVNGADGSAPSPVNQNYGTEVTLPGAGSMTKTGHAFGGWSETSGGTALTSYTVPAEDATLYAVWEIQQYTITFDSAGGSAVAPITQNYGAVVTAPADPTWAGHYFVGWDTAIPATMPAGNIMITATWKTMVNVPVAVAGLVYSGVQQTGVPDGTGYTLSSYIATSARIHIATATLSSGCVWSDGTDEIKDVYWTISPREVFVTPTALSKVLGEADPALTYTLSEPISVTGTLSRAAGEGAGTYAMTLGSLEPVLGNYILTLAPSNFEIIPEGTGGTEDAGDAESEETAVIDTMILLEIGAAVIAVVIAAMVLGRQ